MSGQLKARTNRAGSGSVSSSRCPSSRTAIKKKGVGAPYRMVRGGVSIRRLTDDRVPLNGDKEKTQSAESQVRAACLLLPGSLGPSGLFVGRLLDGARLSRPPDWHGVPPSGIADVRNRLRGGALPRATAGP